MARGRLLALGALGAGLIAAPVVFQMFSRAPKGADMIVEFGPYMTDEVITRFVSDLELIDAALDEYRADVAPRLDPSVRTTYVGRFDQEWPVIHDDMGGMLTTMGEDVPRFEGVEALPSFELFPWFFVLPGALLLFAAIAGLRSPRGRWPLGVAVVIGVGLVAAPVVFQMFSRAPEGARMIDDFRPFMTVEKVQSIQGYFLVIGAGEGNVRNDVLPAVGDDVEAPLLRQFSEQWPRISNDMAPMIGAMSDNIDNYEAVDALPSFALFPWFFVAPGVLAAALGIMELRRRGLGIGDSTNELEISTQT
jgi:hypothetical protein